MPARIAKPSKPGPQRPGFFVCALVVLALGASDASSQVRTTGDYLARMDSDGDGRVALAEYHDWMRYAFDGMDRNRDDVLGPDELPGGRGKPVTRTEHNTRLTARFNRQDLDRDGFLDSRELAAPPQ